MSLLSKYQFSTLKIAFIVILFIQLLLMLWMSQNVGISADESRHIQQAEKVYNYYKTHGEDKSALENTGVDPMQYNGQSFDNLMYWITQKFEVENYIEMRHFFNALIGWLIILITGLLAKKIYGYEGAILAVLLLFISPRFLGHSLNNNKDIPFALGFILSIYGMTGFFQALPKLRYKDIILLTLGIAFAISIRLAGILAIAFLGVYSVLFYLTRKPLFRPFEKTKKQIFSKLVIVVPLVIVAGYFLGIVYWPFMMEDPVKNMKVILDATSSHPVGLTQLFEGKQIISSNIPSYYTLRYLSISYPLVILTGISLAFLLAPFALKRDKLFLFFEIAFAFVFVFFWMSYKTSNYYGGIRHLLFIYPLAVCLAVFGFIFLKELVLKLPVKWLSYLPYALVTLLSLNPILHIIRNYPYSYVYFNELAGGVKKAYDKYETDYFQHSLRRATEWFVANELPKHINDTSKVKVITNDFFNTGYYLRGTEDKLDYAYIRYYERSKEKWDYAIFYCGYIVPQQITDKLWPPKGTIHTEEVDGFPIAAVVKRVSDEDYKGYMALLDRKNDEAEQHFRNFLKIYPESEEGWQGIAQVKINERDYDSTIVFANKALEYNPRLVGALMLVVNAQNNSKDYTGAVKTADNILSLKEDFAEAHFQKGFALKNLGQPNEALKELQLAIAYKEDMLAAYYQIGEILGNYKNYKNAIEVYGKILEKKPDDFVAEIFSARNYYLMGDIRKAKEIVGNVDQNMQMRLETVALKCRMALDEKDLRMAYYYLQMARNIQTYGDIFVLRARFALAQNNRQTAIDELKKGKEVDPFNREIQELLKSLENNSVQQAQQANQAQKADEQPQSIMYQKPEKQPTSPITIPVK